MRFVDASQGDFVTATSHAWDAQQYRQHSSQQQKWARELFDQLALAGHERVLDIGCGDGKVTAEIARHLPRGSVVGVDLSREMLDLAKKSFPPTHFANLSFRPMDAARLEFNSEFDVIFSNAALHWVVDHRPVLGGISAALRPGGRVVLSMGGHGNAAALLAVLQRVIAQPRWASFFEGFSFPYGFHAPDRYRSWVEAAGLVPSRVELVPKDMTHAGRAGLEGWFRTTWFPYTASVPDDQREAFIDEVLNEYLTAHPLDQHGNAHVAMVRLEVQAVKR
jgi:trans-aconitate methyltransferase